MPAKRKKIKRDPAYLRNQGNRKEVKSVKRNITFSLSKQLKGEGQSIEEWHKLGLLGKLNTRLKYVGQYPTAEVRQKQYIKEYTKVSFPPDSDFKEPKHLNNVTWAVMHLTPNSKEVVVGYIEDDVFYIVFLDKDHRFWPTKNK